MIIMKRGNEARSFARSWEQARRIKGRSEKVGDGCVGGAGNAMRPRCPKVRLLARPLIVNGRRDGDNKRYARPSPSPSLSLPNFAANHALDNAMKSDAWTATTHLEHGTILSHFNLSL